MEMPIHRLIWKAYDWSRISPLSISLLVLFSIAEISERRTELVQEKDSLLGKLHIYINRISPDEMTRNILLDFCN